jgi:hypothetical protein
MATDNARLAALPEQFGRYRILQQLGEGGMGTVYLAHDTQLDRQVALKVPQLTADDAVAVQRFYREARAAAMLQHPNLCPVYDFGEINGIPYLTMPYIEGKLLSAYIRPGRQNSQRQVAALVHTIALALQEAHSRGVIHRDLKPSNIKFNQRREPVVMDFGLARQINKPGECGLTQHGTAVGTSYYMSPEQALGELDYLDQRTDIFSLGVILYELLTGQLPFQGPDKLAVQYKIVRDDPPRPSGYRPDLDPQLEAICLKAMAKKVEDRYASMGQFAAVLGEYLQRVGQSAPAAKNWRAEQRPTSSSSLSKAHAKTVQVFTELPSREPAFRIARPAHVGADWRHRMPRWLWPAVGAAALFSLLSVVILVRTPEGTIQITLSDPQAQVVVKVDGNTVEITGLERPLRLRVGQHQLEVTGQDFQTITRSFTVRRGDNPVLHVELLPKDAVKAGVQQASTLSKKPTKLEASSAKPPAPPGEKPQTPTPERIEPGDVRRITPLRPGSVWIGQLALNQQKFLAVMTIQQGSEDLFSGTLEWDRGTPGHGMVQIEGSVAADVVTFHSRKVLIGGMDVIFPVVYIGKVGDKQLKGVWHNPEMTKVGTFNLVRGK